MKTAKQTILTTLGLGIGFALLGSACGTSTPGGDGGVGGGAVSTGGSGTPVGGGATVGGSGNPAGGSNSGGGSNASGGAVVGTDGGAPNSGGAVGTDGGGPPAGGSIGVGGGAPTGGGANVVKPALVVSGKNNYFKESALTEGGTTPTVTVDATKTHQKMYGFGGAFNEKGWVALMALDEAKRAEALKLLFGRDAGNFWWGRIPMGASDYGRKAFTYDDIASGTDYPMAQFSIATDKDPAGGVIPFIKEAQKVRQDIKFWGSPWTPPPWMKDNNAYNLGSMKNTKENLDAYAQYFVKFINAYEAEGIPIHSVHPQNEPGWQQNYPTCGWGMAKNSETNAVIETGAFLGKFVVNNLAPALTAASLSTEIWYGTFSNGDYCDEYWADLTGANGLNLIKGVGLQWSGKNIAKTVRQAKPDMIIMQSEHQCGNYPWKGTTDKPAKSTAASKEAANDTTFWEGEAPNNHNYGIETWNLMKEWIVTHDVNVYSAWNMVLDTKGLSLDTVRPWPQNALLVVDTAAKTLTATPAYYVFRHFSQFLDEGAVRIDASGEALAFQNPDKSIITIIYNKGTADAATVVSVGGKMYTVTIPATGWATLNVKGS